MAYARVSYTGDSSTKIFSVPFPYLDASYVEVRVAGVLKSVTTHYTWLTSSTIQFVTAPVNGATVYILRNTPKEARLVNYQDAAILRETDLDLDSDQAFHIAQETLDASVNSRAVEIFVGGTHYTAGVTTSLTLGDSTVEKPSLTVLFDAAVQQQTEYSLASGVITFTSAIPVGVAQVQVSYAAPLATGLIDGSVTSSKLSDGAGTTAKLADGSVTTTKLNDLVVDGLIAVSAATTDYVPIADASDSNKKKKTLVSSILGLIASATTAVLGLVQMATITEAKAGSDSSKAVTPQGVSNHYGVVKSWVTFNGTTGSILGSAGVSSVTRNATGDYTINFSTAFLANTYCIGGSAEDNNSLGSTILTRYPADTRTTGACRVRTIGDDGAAVDSAYVSVFFLGYW